MPIIEIEEAIYRKLVELRGAVLALKKLHESWESLFNSARENTMIYFQSYSTHEFPSQGSRNQYPIPSHCH
jgi:hypothetical protein